MRYNSVQVQTFINQCDEKWQEKRWQHVWCMMPSTWSKSAPKRNGLEVFEQAIKNVAPVMEVKPRRVGGATYQIPMEVPTYRRFALATRWILAGRRCSLWEELLRKAGRRTDGCSQQHRRSHPQA